MKYLRKKSVRCIVAILIFSILIEITAQDGIAAQGNKIMSNIPQKKESKHIVKEKDNLRTEYSKTFIQNDGTYLQVCSTVPLHKKENGVYKDIDNKIEKKDKNSWKNKSGNYNVTFPKSLEKDIEVQYTEHKFRMKMISSDSINKSVSGSAATLMHASVYDVRNTIKTSNYAKQKLGDTNYSSYIPNSGGVISYAHGTGTQITYETRNNQIKESIILNSRESIQKSYTYQIKANGLQAIKQLDGSICFYKKKKNNIIYYLEKPYMFDSAKKRKISCEIQVKLKKKKGNYYLTYIPAKKWMEDEQRVFPITIDPTISIGGGMHNSADGIDGVCIRSDMPNSGWNPDVVELNANSQGAYIFKSNVFPGKELSLLSAKLQIQATNSDKKNAKIGVKEIESECDLSTVCWNKRPKVASEWMDYTGFNGCMYVSLDITSYIDKIRNGDKNNGIWLTQLQGGEASFWGMGGNVQMLYVMEYSSMQKEDSELSKKIYSLGRSGDVTVFNSTGYAQYEGVDLSLSGRRMPVTIKRVYDGTNKNNVGMGKFRTNYHQRIIYDKQCDINKLYSEDGGIIEFEPGEEEAGNYKINWDNALSGDDYENIVITNPDGYTLHFDNKGRLVEMSGCSQKVTSTNTISYINDSELKIDKIRDGAGGEYLFVYNNGDVSEIQYRGKGKNIIKKVRYSYESRGEDFLVSVTYPDKKTSSYFFDQNNQLYQICDVSSRWLQMRYDTLGRVYQIWENGKYGAMGDRVTYKYAPMCTSISDKNGNVNLIQFNRDGQVTGVYNQNGEAVVSSVNENGALLGFSDICSSVIGDNLITSSEKYDAPYGEHPLTPASMSICKHDDSVPILSGKNYDKINPNMETTTYSLHTTKSGSYPEGYKITFGGWLKGKFQKGDYPSRGVVIELTIFYLDGTNEKRELEPNLYISDWQYVLQEIQLSKEAKRFSVNLKLIRQTNPICVSQIELKCKKAELETEDASNESETTPTSSADIYGNIVYSKDEKGVETSNSYDEYGNVKSHKTTVGNLYMYSSNIYKEGDLITSVTNENGFSERYKYDEDKNCIRKDYDTGKIILYTYDAAGNVISEQLCSDEGELQNNNFLNEIIYAYDSDDNVKMIKTENDVYNFAYTQFGDLGTIKHGSDNLVAYEYKSNSNRILSKKTYGNESGDGKNTIQYYYNDKNQLIDDGQATYTYQNNGEVKQISDRITNQTITWDGNKRTAINSGNLLYEYEEKSDGVCFRNSQGTQYVKNKTESDYVNSQTLVYDGKDVFQQTDQEDKFGHKVSANVINGKDGTSILNKSYEYRKIGKNRITNQISAVITQIGGEQNSEIITYDISGNISSIKDQDGNETNYLYDKKGQLIRENNKKMNYTMIFEYDNEGNILKRTKYPYSKNQLGNIVFERKYTYSNDAWKDLLSEYNGQKITYDKIGNPIKYCGRNLSWTKGRQLESNIKDGVTTTYQYDANGIRTKKIVGDKKTDYTYIDGKLYAMKSSGVELTFSYDDQGNPFGVCYNGQWYLYQTNIQGDVIGIVNYNGVKVASYEYDAFGKILYSSTSAIGQINPLRYRGYVYDVDTGWYYLQSRYYDSDTGRFINIDEPEMLLSNQDNNMLQGNLFVYCCNRYIGMDDVNGYFGTPIQWVCAAIGAVAGWILGDYIARSLGFKPGKWWQWRTYAYWTVRGLVVVGGAILGWIAGTVLLRRLCLFLTTHKAILAKMPKIVLWFLGMGGVDGEIAAALYERFEKHIFTKKHDLDGLVKKFGKRGLFNKAFKIISSKIVQAENGSNQIYTKIGGVKITIRFNFLDGSIRSINIIKGWIPRIIGKLLR